MYPMCTQDEQELKSMHAILIHLYCKQTPCFLALTCVRVAQDYFFFCTCLMHFYRYINNINEKSDLLEPLNLTFSSAILLGTGLYPEFQRWGDRNSQN